MAKKILITGGAGFIGSNLAKIFSKKNFSVAILDDFSSGREIFVPPNCEIFRGDVADQNFVKNIFKKFQPQIVSHHAAHVSVRASAENPIFDAEKNIFGAINIFENAGKFGAEKIIFASTGGAMISENEKKFPVREKFPRILASPYAISKFSAEKYLQFFAKKFGFCATIFRYANVFGPRQTPKSEAGVVAIFCEKMLQNCAPKIFGSGRQRRDFIFIDDICAANLLATEKNFPGIFNLGTGREISVLQIFEKIAAKINFSKKPIFAKKNDGELFRASLDSQKFRKISGWRSKINFENGLQKTIFWWKNFLKK